MAKEKKSVVLYCDLIHTVEKLDDETAGKLFKHYLRYVNDQEPEPENMIVEVVFEPIKQQLKRDLSKWESMREARSRAGKKSAEARQQKSTKSTRVKFVQQEPTNSTVNVNVNANVNGNDIVSVNKKEYNAAIQDCYEKIILLFPEHLRPKNEKDKIRWLDTVEKLNRIDKLSLDYIYGICKVVRADSFWASNFLSITKLRKKKEGIMYIQIFHEKFKPKKNKEEHLRGIAKENADWSGVDLSAIENIRKK